VALGGGGRQQFAGEARNRAPGGQTLRDQDENEARGMGNLTEGLKRRERHQRRRSTSGGGAPATFLGRRCCACGEGRRSGARGVGVVSPLYRWRGEGERAAEAVGRPFREGEAGRRVGVRGALTRTQRKGMRRGEARGAGVGSRHGHGRRPAGGRG
jgi:hypothetical protein